MTYRPHSPPAPCAPSVRSARWQRPLSQRPASAPLATPPAPAPAAPRAMVGLLYGLPTSLLLWAGIIAAAKAIF